MSVELRPLSLGELLDRTFTYYREHFWTFVGIMAPAEAVAVAATLVLQALGIQAVLRQGPGPVTPSQQFAAFGAFFSALSITVLISLFVHSIALGATSVAVSKIHLGSRITITEAYRSLKDSVGRIVGLYGLYILIVIGAYIAVALAILVVAGIAAGAARLLGVSGAAMGIVVALIMIPALIAIVVLATIVCMRYTLAVPALVLEKLGPGKALGRSSRLAQGRTGQIFLACLLMYLILAVVSAAIQTPFWVAGLLMGFKFGHNPTWLVAPAAVAGGAGAVVGYPFLTIVLTLFYYDSRVRKEGFDLQFMLSSMGPAPVADPGALVSYSERLPRTSVALTVILSFLTAGIYQPLWYLTRVKAFNRLNSSEKLARGSFIGILSVVGASLILPVLSPLAGARRADTSSLGGVFGLGAGIALLLQAFKARRILEEHLNGQTGGLFAQPVSLNAVAVFFFNIWYLQYKINGLMGVIYAEAAPTAIGSVAAIGSGSPRAPMAS